uniref:Biopterin-dependent aromatic amino acid hydroxylase family profile domain-containing protein n=1 Tax=Anas platyrhynchos TaxID=8839 RepID=A0A8B9ZER4_ANAPL
MTQKHRVSRALLKRALMQLASSTQVVTVGVLSSFPWESTCCAGYLAGSRRSHYFKCYSCGDPVPKIEFTEEEVKTWGTVYQELNKFYPAHACREYLKHLPLLKYCGYRENNIPQLEDVSLFLKERAGFTIRLVVGYLSPRDFLVGLAFRVFHCTRYVRHGSDPLYTPEPDTCHELLGHISLLAEPNFAQFWEIGLASLGASDEAVQKLATVRFGLCKQEGQLRVYGASLLSSISGLKHLLSGSAKVKPLHPKVTCKQECLITTFQERVCKNYHYPFGMKYNPYTQSVQILKDTKSIASMVNELRRELDVVIDAISKMGKQLEVKHSHHQCGVLSNSILFPAVFFLGL